jgi:membrane protease YdiL (CAAX protease family)
MGLVVSFGLVLVATGVVGLFGIKVVHFSANGLAWQVVTLSLLVAVAEEVLHRGFIFQSLSSELGSFLAIVLSSAVFSMLHFTYPSDAAALSGNSMDILSGFKTLPRIVERFTDFSAILPDAAGYFLLGSLFCVMSLKLDSLYAAVAAHALLVFVNLSRVVTFKGRLLVGKDMVFGARGSVSETFAGSLMAWFLILLAIIAFLAAGGLSPDSRRKRA